MQDRWENREYVVEKWPYPNLPVYVVHPRDGEGHGKPYIGTICYPSTLTWGRMKQMDLKKESKITPLQLQCHLQVTACQIVQINLLLLDVAFEPPEINFPGGIETLLLTDARPTGIQDAQVDLHVFLHILAWLYNTFKWGAV